MTSQPPLVETAVVGSGYMGGGIAQVLALAGYRVHLGDIDAATAEAARVRLVAQSRVFETEGLFRPGSAATIDANLVAANSIEDAVASAGYITEAVPEILELKLAILARIAVAAGPAAIIGSNTSAIPINTLAVAVRDPGRFLGVHWMNPAPFIPGVELIPTEQTSAETIDTTEALIGSLGKLSARVSDTPGFVANRLQFALYHEAARIVDEGIATPTQIDDVVSNTFGFRLALFGPFAIGDMAGLDVYSGSYKTLEAAYGERFAAPKALEELVGAGNIGLKSGHGFLDIAEGDRTALLKYRDNAYARLLQLRVELGPPPGL
jgi:3-hydroxybutyryl-CoA dehydrogenase